MSVLDETKDSLLRQIAATLLLLQQLERLMIDTLAHSSNPFASNRSVDEFDKRTMGVLITTLRQRVTLADTFASDLTGLLDDRNMFIHRLSVQTWFDMDSIHGQLALIEFLRSFHQRAGEATKIFLAYVMSESDAHGTKPEHYSEKGKKAFVRELRRDYLRGIAPKA